MEPIDQYDMSICIDAFTFWYSNKENTKNLISLNTNEVSKIELRCISLLRYYHTQMTVK